MSHHLPSVSRRDALALDAALATAPTLTWARGSTAAHLEAMLLYCGITMVRPMTEIAHIFEKQENVKISIAQGGSEDLYQSVAKGTVGDWYLPGEPSFFQGPERQQFFAERVLVGYNKMALMVAKGNPKQLKPDLKELLRKDLAVALGNPDSGSVGKESKRLLETAGLYDKAVRSAALLAPDSRSITNALKKGEVDAALNWKATAYFPDNIDKLEAIELDRKVAVPQPLMLLRLNSSRRPDLATRFLALAASDQGKAIFQKYGFVDATAAAAP
jgi:molybdate transport system substrate-binding protein